MICLFPDLKYFYSRIQVPNLYMYVFKSEVLKSWSSNAFDYCDALRFMWFEFRSSFQVHCVWKLL